MAGDSTLGLGALAEGSEVPRDIKIRVFPETIVQKIPKLKDYKFFTAEKADCHRRSARLEGRDCNRGTSLSLVPGHTERRAATPCARSVETNRNGWAHAIIQRAQNTERHPIGGGFRGTDSHAADNAGAAMPLDYRRWFGVSDCCLRTWSCLWVV